MTTTNHDDQLEIYPAMLNKLNCIFGISFSRFYARQHICYSAYMPRQFRPSVTRVYCIKTAERIIEILSPSVRPIILVFRQQVLLRKSDGFTPNGGAKYKGGSNFRPICGLISETVRDKRHSYHGRRI